MVKVRHNIDYDKEPMRLIILNLNLDKLPRTFGFKLKNRYKYLHKVLKFEHCFHL